MDNATPASQIIEDMRGIQVLLNSVDNSGNMPSTVNASLRVIQSMFPAENTIVIDERGLQTPYGGYPATPLFGKALLPRKSVSPVTAPAPSPASATVPVSDKTDSSSTSFTKPKPKPKPKVQRKRYEALGPEDAPPTKPAISESHTPATKTPVEDRSDSSKEPVESPDSEKPQGNSGGFLKKVFRWWK